MNIQGKTALVTGASSGIGVRFARQLAARGANLVVTARRHDRLVALKEELEAAHGIQVLTIAEDLSAPDGASQLIKAIQQANQSVDVLINNAGFGTQNPFVDIPWKKTAQQLHLNIVALTELTHHYATEMKERGGGHILNVASIAAYLPIPYYATYAATKAYVRNFSEAIAYELRNTGVRVCSLCPGPTHSEFMDVSGHKLSPLAKSTFMSAERCARIGLRALFGWRWNIVSGWMNRLMVTSLRFAPRWMVTRIAAVVMGR